MVLNCKAVLESDLSNVNNLFSEANVVKYIKKISQYQSLSAEEEMETAKLAKEGDIKAKQKLIKANLKLVVTIAKKVIHTSKLPMTDLIQEGNIGLMVAADKFNWKFGYRFATYASWWIKQSMFKAISEQSYSIKIPVYIQETLSRYSKMKLEMERNGKSEAAPEEIAGKINIDADKIYNYMNAYKKTLSLEGDFEIKNGSEVRLVDIIEDKKSSVTNVIEQENLKKDIKDIIKELKEREQKVIMLRFGLEGCEKQTLEEIGKLYGVTKECIRQTESRALNKLKNNTGAYKIYEDYVC